MLHFPGYYLLIFYCLQASQVFGVTAEGPCCGREQILYSPPCLLCCKQPPPLFFLQDTQRREAFPSSHECSHTGGAPRGPLPWGQAERGDRARPHSLASPAQAAPALLSLSAPLTFCPCGCCVVVVLGHCRALQPSLSPSCGFPVETPHKPTLFPPSFLLFK